jgi:excisionase family DNA binding protein
MKNTIDPALPRWLGVEEVAAELRVSPRSVRRAVASGDLPHVQLRKGGAIRVPAEALQPTSRVGAERR